MSQKPPRRVNLLQPAPPSRRDFLRGAALSAVAAGSLGLAGCCGGDDDPTVAFAHGVASGEPLADRVILWTRLSVDDGSEVELR